MKLILRYLFNFFVVVIFCVLVFYTAIHNPWIKQNYEMDDKLQLLKEISTISGPTEYPDKSIFAGCYLSNTDSLNHAATLDSALIDAVETQSSESLSGTGESSKTGIGLTDVNTRTTDSLSLARIEKKKERVEKAINLFRILDMHIDNLRNLSHEEEKQQNNRMIAR